MKKLVDLKDIDVKHSPHVRAELNEGAVSEYTERYRTKKPMPEAILFEIGKNSYLVGDGLHRIAAMREAGIGLRTFDVRQGGYEDCLKFALTANDVHGLRRTNEDKRVGVQTALLAFAKLSNNQVAEIAGVNETTVSRIRKEMEANSKIEPITTRTDKKGRTVNVSNIGPTMAKPELASQKPNENTQIEAAGSVQAVSIPTGSSEASLIYDETGRDTFKGMLVPARARPIWDRRNEVVELLSAIRKVKSVLKKAEEENDLMYAEFRLGGRWQRILTMVTNLHSDIQLALPFAVCPACQGQLIDKCALCNKRGVVSKFLFNTVPEEQRKLREKAARKIEI